MAAAHVVTCEGVRRESARRQRRRQCVPDARGGRSLRGAGRVVGRASSLRVPRGLPVPAASRPVAPRPFPRLPPAARRSSGDEFRHLFRDDPGTRAPREEEGGRGGEDGGCAGRPALPRDRVPRGSLLAQLPVRVDRARWSGTSLCRGGDRQASARGDGGPWDLAPRVARKGDPPEESGGGHRGAWASSPAVSSGSRLRVGTPRAKTSRGLRVGTRSRPP